MYILQSDLNFPPVEYADEEGLLCIGGDLSPQRLQKAYSSGIFPWYEIDGIIFWFSPNPRCILYPDSIKVSKSMKQFMRKEKFSVSFNQQFKEVIDLCGQVIRKDQESTWISPYFKMAYEHLFKIGMAQSVEVWNEKNELVGGLYGTDIGNGIFCGESMFSLESNASKFALIKLAEKLAGEKYQFIDCQIMNPHLASLGAVDVDRSDFIKFLENC